MRSSLSFAVPALVIALAARPGMAGAVPSPFAAWKWERAIVPNPASPAAEQCAVLDASLFAGAAPGLRDVRLLQDGRELAYAIDISLDDSDGRAATVPAVDRALYETTLVIPALPSQWPGPAPAGRLPLPPDHPPGWFYGKGVLPAHVPVERIRLDSSGTGTEFLALRAADISRLDHPEEMEATLTRESPAVAFTVGANLQHEAEVGLGVHGESGKVSAFVLEMRRREICYQPLSASPVTLLFGNTAALPVHYDFGRYFQPKATPLLSTMGTIHANPAFYQRPSPHADRALRTKLMLAILACVFALVITLRSLLRAKR